MIINSKKYNLSNLIDTMTNNVTNIRNITIITDNIDINNNLTEKLSSDVPSIFDDINPHIFRDTRIDRIPTPIYLPDPITYLYYELNINNNLLSNNKLLINLINSSDIGENLSITDKNYNFIMADSSIIVIDAIEKCSVRLIKFIEESLNKLVKPICFINNLDELILESSFDTEIIYGKLFNKINELKSIIKSIPNHNFELEIEDIIFGSINMQFGFSLSTIVSKWAPVEKLLINNLWFDNYYDLEEKKWYNYNKTGSVRGFNLFCLELIIHIMHYNHNVFKSPKCIVKTNKLDYLTNKKNVKKIFKSLLNLKEPILDLAINKLPNPIQAQNYRIDKIYFGPKDEYYYDIKNCNQNGKLIIYIDKIIIKGFDDDIYSKSNKIFYMFGRILSGSLATPIDNSKILYIFNDNINDVLDININKINNVSIIENYHKTKNIANAGNLILLNYYYNNYKCNNDDEYINYKYENYGNNSLINVQILEPNSILKTSLYFLLKTNLFGCNVNNENDKYIISSFSELGINKFVNFMKGVFDDVNISKPYVSLKKTVISPFICEETSQNSLNKMKILGNPVENLSLVENLNDNILYYDKNNNISVISNYYLTLSNEDKLILKKAIRITIKFSDVEIKNVTFSITEMDIETNPIKLGQISSCFQKAIKSIMSSSQSRFVEPIYHINIWCNNEYSNDIINIILEKNGKIIYQNNNYINLIDKLKVEISVNNSIGLFNLLDDKFKNDIFYKISLNSWKIMDDVKKIEN